MGSPASPVIADIVMEELLDETLAALEVAKHRILIIFVVDLLRLSD